MVPGFGAIPALSVFRILPPVLYSVVLILNDVLYRIDVNESMTLTWLSY